MAMKTKSLLAGITVVILVVVWGVVIPLKQVRAQSVGYVGSGQQAVTATAAVLSGMSYGTACVKALKGNTINVYLGGYGVTDSTGMELAPGDSYCSLAANPGTFYVIASTTGASVSWIVSR